MATTEVEMFMQRIFTEGLAQASFLIGSEQTHEAVVIDPRRDIDLYLSLAKGQGLTITRILETHIHADYASGARELAARTDATICLGEHGDNDFEHVRMADGDTFSVGELRFQILHTPGHTPEHISILLTDTTHPDAAPMLFSGDTLFVGSVGRPDLLGESHTQALASALYRTVHEKLMPLDDQIIVYPGHGAGSACGKSIGDAPSTTIGQERRFNEAFQPLAEDAFVRLMLEGLPDSPRYFPVMKRLNKQGPQILGNVPHPEQLDMRTLREMHDTGATIIDVRSPVEFGRGFLAGSLNIGLGPNMPNWAGWTVSYEHPIVLVVARTGDVAPAVTQLIRIGLDDIRGYLIADATTLGANGSAPGTVEQLDPYEAARRIDAGAAQLLDVRNATEWASGHAADAIHLAAEAMSRGEMNGIDPTRPTIVTCAGGYRSSLAASMLKRAGFENVANLSGGMAAWVAFGQPVTRD